MRAFFAGRLRTKNFLPPANPAFLLMNPDPCRARHASRPHDLPGRFERIATGRQQGYGAGFA